MNYDVLLPIDDWIFKLLFGDERRKNLLINLLKAFVELPDEEYDLTFLDTHPKAMERMYGNGCNFYGQKPGRSLK